MTPNAAIADVSDYTDPFTYNAADLHATLLSFERLRREGACEMAAFDHAMLGPALTMGLRGLRVDERAAAETLEETWQDVRRLRRQLDRIRKFTWTPKSMKPSPHELARVLYDELSAPAQTNRDGGRTANKEALDAIINSPKSNDEAAECARLALELSRLEEDRKVLEKPRGRDGRMHTGFGVASTVTSRWSSRRDAFNEGANLHALSKRVRRIFTADPGYTLVSRDLNQAESFAVALLSGCEAYKQAHLAGNVHFAVLQRLWPGVAKTKAEAKEKPVPYNPDMTWYDQAKRIQHASNYGQSPTGFARTAHVPVVEAKKSQALYFALFPVIKAWQTEISYQLKPFKRLTTPMGRIRQFLGRTWDDSILKEAIAHVPQSTISDINKIILFRIWRDCDPGLAQCLLEVHDSALVQVKESAVGEFVQISARLAKVEVPVNGDILCIGSTVEVGHNWGKYDAHRNPSGLRELPTEKNLPRAVIN